MIKIAEENKDQTPVPPQPNKDQEPETPSPISPVPDSPPSEDLISQANAAAIRIEEANKKQEELINRAEQQKVEQVLGGKADAGQQPPKEESDEDYAKKVMENDIDTKE